MRSELLSSDETQTTVVLHFFKHKKYRNNTLNLILLQLLSRKLPNFTGMTGNKENAGLSGETLGKFAGRIIQFLQYEGYCTWGYLVWYAGYSSLNFVEARAYSAKKPKFYWFLFILLIKNNT